MFLVAAKNGMPFHPEIINVSGCSYTWQKNGMPFQPENVEDVEVEQLLGTGTVTFRGRGVDERLEGLYQCFADNVYGTSVGIKTNLRMARLPVGLWVFNPFTAMILLENENNNSVKLDF